MGEKAILWFTKDLRVQDNECLSWLCKNEAPFVGLIFKPEGQSEFQKEFFRASAESLQKNLEKFNIKLFCVEGRPETELIKWVKINEINYVLTTSAYNSRDRETINKVDTELRTKSEARLKIFDQSTLLHLEDLPFTLVQLPTTFTPFRKLLEESWRVRDVVEQEYKNLQRLEALVPTETRLLDVDKQSTTLPMPYGIQGGEAAAWDRLKEFLWNTKSIDLYKEKRKRLFKIFTVARERLYFRTKHLS